MLEALTHEYSSFATLSYDDTTLPKNDGGDATLRSEHVRDWLKRFRRAIEPDKVRFYLVGEYGDASWRPHYHAALFGYAPCVWGSTRPRASCCQQCDRIRSTWGFGHIFLGELNVKSAAYIAGYVTKKLTNSNDGRLNGRDPEFARMSLKPGIGGDAMWDVASTILSFGLDEKGDVPAQLRHGPKLMPLGRYLRRRLRTFVGKDASAPPETLLEAKAELLPVWESTKGVTNRGALFKTLALNANDVKSSSLENKSRIWKKRAMI